MSKQPRRTKCSKDDDSVGEGIRGLGFFQGLWSVPLSWRPLFSPVFPRLPFLLGSPGIPFLDP